MSEVNNAALKRLIAKMSEGGLSPKTISDNYVPVVKMVVASAVDEQGEQIYPRKWNHEFIDLPVVEQGKQNTPCFSAEVMTGLAQWKRPRERMIFILCGAAGLRIGEVRTMHSSLMSSVGVRPEITRDNMGHATVDVTQNVYNRTWWEERVEAVSLAAASVWREFTAGQQPAR